MDTITAESVLHLIAQMPPTEKSKLKKLMEQRGTMQSPAETANGTTPKPAQQLDKRMPPKPMPDGTCTRQWLAQHRREYADQWVALDGDRLIAAGKDHDAVWAAAEADGAHLPLITFIEDPDNLTTIIWT